nr:MAG TPA: hypothetical protein [Caudoviricetes sp.]
MKCYVKVDSVTKVIYACSTSPMMGARVIEVDNIADVNVGYDTLDGRTYTCNKTATGNGLEAAKLQFQIREVANELAATDHEMLKYIEGEISFEHFAVVKAKRKELRKKLRALLGKPEEEEPVVQVVEPSIAETPVVEEQKVEEDTIEIANDVTLVI